MRRISTPTSGSPIAASRPRWWLGAWTTGPAHCASSVTATTCGWNAGCPAVTSTSTWPSRRSSPADCTVSKTAWNCRNRAPAMRTRRPASSVCPVRWPKRRPSSMRRQSPERHSGMRWLATTSTTPASRWTRSMRQSPIGRGFAGLSGSDNGRSSTVPPVIGLTTYLAQARLGVWDVPASFLPAVYFQGVTAAGGVATLLPPQPVHADIAERVLDGLDGLLITGGNDVDPAVYGQPPHPGTDKPSQQRDAWEFALLRAALKRGLPVLGICRGAQVLNVALGGTLHQHLPDVVGHSRHQAGNAVFSTSRMHIDPGTRLATLVGEHSDGQCYHHQAIAELGKGLIVSARDRDGVIE